MQVDRVIDVKRRQQCEDIGLDRGNQQLERADSGDEQEAEDRDHRSHHAFRIEAGDDEASEHLDEDVAGAQG